MNAIEKMVEWLEILVKGDGQGNGYLRQTLDKARALAAEQSKERPAAPADLVGLFPVTPKDLDIRWGKDGVINVILHNGTPVKLYASYREIRPVKALPVPDDGGLKGIIQNRIDSERLTSYDFQSKIIIDTLVDILSRYTTPASVEPLSRLAYRKGRHYEPSICDDGCEPMFFENENAIRKYLLALPDTK